MYCTFRGRFRFFRAIGTPDVPLDRRYSAYPSAARCSLSALHPNALRGTRPSSRITRRTCEPCQTNGQGSHPALVELPEYPLALLFGVHPRLPPGPRRSDRSSGIPFRTRDIARISFGFRYGRAYHPLERYPVVEAIGDKRHGREAGPSH